MCWLTDWERRKEALEEEIFGGKNPPAPPAPPTANNSGPEEEPEEPAEEQGLLFDYGRPTCHCGYVIDEATRQTGVCPNCDEILNPDDLIVEKDEPLDDQTELSFVD